MSQLVTRTLDLIEHIAANKTQLTTMAIAADLGMDKSTCARLLSSLQKRGWVTRDPVTHVYSPGATMIGLSLDAALTHDLRRVIYPTLEHLRDLTGETISFQRRVGLHRIAVAGVEASHVIRGVLPIGSVLKLSEGPSGKIICAFLDDQDIRSILETTDARSARVRAQLELARSAGYLSTDGDRTVSMGAIAVPVFDHLGVYGSITIAGPSQRFTAEVRAEHRVDALSAASSVSRSLGADTRRFAEWVERVRSTAQVASDESSMTVSS